MRLALRRAFLHAKFERSPSGRFVHRNAVPQRRKPALKAVLYQGYAGEDGKSLLLDLVEDMSVNTRRHQFVNWANTAVGIWARILPPAEGAKLMLALKERIRKLSSASPYVGKRTPRGDLVAATLARAGLIDEALTELAIWLCTDAPDPNIYNRFVIQPRSPARC